MTVMLIGALPLVLHTTQEPHEPSYTLKAQKRCTKTAKRYTMLRLVWDCGALVKKFVHGCERSDVFVCFFGGSGSPEQGRVNFRGVRFTRTARRGSTTRGGTISDDNRRLVRYNVIIDALHDPT